MRSRLCALVAALALVVSSTAKAEIYNMYTFPNPSGPNLSSSLGLDISILGLINISVPAAQITGSATVDMNLDATNSGTLYVTGSTLTLADTVGSQDLGLLGIINYSLVGVGIQISAGPIQVTNGSFVINNTTVGALVLSSGTINLNGNLAIVGTIDENIDLSTDPIDVTFSGLPPGITLPGTADDDLGGFDVIDSNPHTLGGPGLTGLSTIDNDGSEVRIAWNGTNVTTTITTGTLALPVSITLRGNGLAVGVPEASTVVMVGMAMAGFGFASFRRRRSA